MRTPVAFLGMSHLGIVSSAAWASKGLGVLAVDSDATLVQRLRSGDLPVHEPGLSDLIAVGGHRLRYTAHLSELAGCALVVVSRDVPTDGAGDSQPEVVLELIDAALPHLPPDATLVVMSQVQPGFTRALRERIRAHRPELRFALLYLVETLIFGDAVRRATQPERFIVGADPPDALPSVLRDALARFGCPIMPMSYESAELTKTAINLYLVGSVTYANTMADLCEAAGADWSQMIPALRLDIRIGPAAYLRPGLGVSGGNLERDLVTLRRLGEHGGIDGTFLTALAEHNRRRFGWVLRKVGSALIAAERAGQRPRIALCGLAYKRNTRSTKNAASLKLIGALLERADIVVWDPLVGEDELRATLGPDHGVRLAASAVEAAQGSDCLAVVADWEQFGQEDLATVSALMRRAVLVDCVGVVDPARAESAGLSYHGMGRA